MDRTFESKCGHCKGRITGNGGTKPWRHDVAPAKSDKHHAYPTGTMVQL